MPSSSPVTVLYCSQRDGRVGLYDPVIGNNTRYVIVIVYNSMVQYILSKPQTWAGPPSLPFFPSLRHIFYIAAVDSCSTISSVVTAVVSAKIWNTDWGQLSGQAVQS